MLLASALPGMLTRVRLRNEVDCVTACNTGERCCWSILLLLSLLLLRWCAFPPEETEQIDGDKFDACVKWSMMCRLDEGNSQPRCVASESKDYPRPALLRRSRDSRTPD
jgi:hypothetical protein